MRNIFRFMVSISMEVKRLHKKGHKYSHCCKTSTSKQTHIHTKKSDRTMSNINEAMWCDVIRCGCCHKRGPFQKYTRTIRRWNKKKKESSKFSEYLSNRRACVCARVSVIWCYSIYWIAVFIEMLVFIRFGQKKVSLSSFTIRMFNLYHVMWLSIVLFLR